MSADRKTTWQPENRKSGRGKAVAQVRFRRKMKPIIGKATRRKLNQLPNDEPPQ